MEEQHATLKDQLAFFQKEVRQHQFEVQMLKTDLEAAMVPQKEEKPQETDDKKTDNVFAEEVVKLRQEKSQLESKVG